MPAGFVQLIYRTGHADGEKLVSHPLMGAVGYTGSRSAGLTLKTAADRGETHLPRTLEHQPRFHSPRRARRAGDELAQEFTTSCLMGTGQFCTNPGLVVLLGGPASETFVNAVAKHFQEAPAGPMLGEGARRGLAEGIKTLAAAGAKIVAGGKPRGGPAISYENTLLRVDGDAFLAAAERLQTEAFGNESLFVVAKDAEQMVEIARQLEGNLTGCIYSHRAGKDDALYDRVAAPLRTRVGRLLNDKMPTGVAVSSAMNHGGPYPATGHPGFTAVGIPASLRRFAMLECYDNVRPHRLPAALRDENPTKMWRLVDGSWSQE